jgi:TRAP-type C4-dicarboxylate transport system permease small subunit
MRKRPPEDSPLEAIRAAAHPEQREGWPERLALWCAELATIAMLVLIATGLIARNFFAYSFDFIHEFSGYLLVCSFFMSLAACQSTGNFHRVEFLRSRLSLAGRRYLDVGLDTMSLLGCLILLWFVVRFEWLTWTREEVANTLNATPLFIPRVIMPLGTALLCYALIRSIARLAAELKPRRKVIPAGSKELRS